MPLSIARPVDASARNWRIPNRRSEFVPLVRPSARKGRGLPATTNGSRLSAPQYPAPAPGRASRGSRFFQEPFPEFRSARTSRPSPDFWLCDQARGAPGLVGSYIRRHLHIHDGRRGAEKQFDRIEEAGNIADLLEICARGYRRPDRGANRPDANDHFILAGFERLGRIKETRGEAGRVVAQHFAVQDHPGAKRRFANLDVATSERVSILGLPIPERLPSRILLSAFWPTFDKAAGLAIYPRKPAR